MNGGMYVVAFFLICTDRIKFTGGRLTFLRREGVARESAARTSIFISLRQINLSDERSR